jgi:hypothetical protein
VEELAEADPDVIVWHPCGYGLARTAQELSLCGLLERPEWQVCPTVGNVDNRMEIVPDSILVQCLFILSCLSNNPDHPGGSIILGDHNGA